jgi:uncharacterized protein YqeY
MADALRTRIDADLKKAMLAKDEIAKDALRGAKADVLNREVELGREAKDEEVVAVLQKAVKSRRDSIDAFRAGGRDDAAKKEEAEIEVLSRYLPKALTEDETRAAIAKLVTELGLSSKKDMGRLMKELKSRHEGVDGRVASKIAGEVLK